MEARLGQILTKSGVAKSQLSLLILSLNESSPQRVFAVNESQQMIPASVTKVATASAVLRRLGPSYKFQTTLSSVAAPVASSLRGDLILKGGGDPGFVSETLWYLVNEFTRTGVKRIDGDLLVDDTAFDLVRTDPTRDPERVDRAYDSPVGAMSLNWNAINIFVRPGAKAGEPVSVRLDPIPDYYKVDNKAKTVAGSGNALEVSRVADRVVVRGTLGVLRDEIAVFKNVDDPVDWAGRGLAFFLSQRGITFTGKIKAGVQPASAKTLAKADSKPVSQSVADMMKFSNNFVAEMLTKGLALESGVRPASLESGMKLVQDHLTQDLGLNPAQFKLLNPSGLSRSNRINARDLAEILVQAQRQFPTFSEFLSSFPLAGMDGTLKRRMKAPETSGWVRAKTGNLNGVVSLAGYAGRKDGSLVAFAFIFNGKAAQADSVRQLFDAMASQLVQ